MKPAPLTICGSVTIAHDRWIGSAGGEQSC